MLGNAMQYIKVLRKRFSLCNFLAFYFILIFKRAHVIKFLLFLLYEEYCHAKCEYKRLRAAAPESFDKKLTAFDSRALVYHTESFSVSPLATKNVYSHLIEYVQQKTSPSVIYKIIHSALK